jgi:hypothetical protein
VMFLISVLAVGTPLSTVTRLSPAGSSAKTTRSQPYTSKTPASGSTTPAGESSPATPCCSISFSSCTRQQSATGGSSWGRCLAS